MILFWFLFDLFNLYKLNVNPKVQLMHGHVIKVIKHTGYNNASLKLQVKLDGEGTLLWIVSRFRPNLRWWLQVVPKINDEVYFFVKQGAVITQKDAQVVYGINPQKSCGRFKLVYDLFYDFSSNQSIIVGTLFILIVFLTHKFCGTGASVLYPSAYWLVRMFIEGVII
jgi:hypothetical protein